MIKNFNEMMKLDVSQYVDERDGADYINWARIVTLLHENGAEKVYFEPVVNEKTGSSLFMTEQTFTDKSGGVNRVYETAVKIVIDDLEFIQRGPVTNGSNPVKDNSMTQQRLWNCQCRLFVKGVALRTGLGFSLWVKEAECEEKASIEEDLSKHSISKIYERVCEKMTKAMQDKNISTSELAKMLGHSEEEMKAYMGMYSVLSSLEKSVDAL